MERIRTIGMVTDHNYHGHPVEMSFVTLHCDSRLLTDEQIEIAKRMQEERLRYMAKRMPHSFWKEPE